MGIDFSIWKDTEHPMPPKKTTATKHAVSKPKGVVVTQKKQFTSKKATLASSKGQGTATCESIFSFFLCF